MNRTQEDLREAALHVNYEIQMLQALIESSYGASPVTPLIDNTSLESFVIHVRNLIDFLYPPIKKSSRRSDDIIATHFIGERSCWKVPQPEITDLLTDARRRANKLAAHLTYSRLELPKNWEPLKIYSDMWIRLQWFFSELPAERREWFPALAETPHVDLSR